MQTGAKISGAAHAALIVWAILGGTLFHTAPPAEVNVSEVALLSEAEFAALMAPVPEAVVDMAEPVAPGLANETPELPRATPAPETNPADTPAPPQLPEDRPDLAAVLELPVTEAEDRAPVAPTPPTADEVAVLAPVTDTAPPRAAARVAPVPTPEPAPDVPRAPEQRDATVPDPDAETQAPPSDAAAPEAAAPEIVTEAEQEDSSTAPVRSVRPRARPAHTPRPASSEDAVAAAIAAELAAAQARRPDPDEPKPEAERGPPLSGGERDRLRLAVQNCWNVGALSSEALRVTVVVGVEMNRDATPRADTVRRISATGGSESAARQAYEAARRAIIRCGARGFDLPAEKYERWRDIEITFNPENMRIR